MNQLIPPIRLSFDVENELSRFEFSEDSIALSGRYFMRGGICWPVRLPEEKEVNGVKQGVRGYALMCGFNIASGVIYVFSQKDFVIIEPIIDPATGVFQPWPFLHQWLNECWSRWFCQSFFWRQDDLTSKKYRLQILRSEMIQPKPHLISIEWQDDTAAVATVNTLDGSDRLIYSQSSPLKRAMEEYDTRRNAKGRETVQDLFIPPELYALMVALNGMEKRNLDWIKQSAKVIDITPPRWIQVGEDAA